MTDQTVVADEKVRFIGQPVAAVAASDEDTAEEALGLIEVEYEELEPIFDVEKAMLPGYSTAPEWVRELGFGAGMGLANIKQCCESLEITSKVGQGTNLKMQFVMEQECA